MRLSERLTALQADIERAAAICERYTPKDASRDEHFRHAAACFFEFALELQQLQDEHGHLLRAAEAAELVAESDEVAA
jgi:hypothetical protein